MAQVASAQQFPFVWEGTDIKTRQSVFFLARSFDGGSSFEKARKIATVHDVGVPDPVSGRIVFDGYAGTRTDSFPSLSIANGAPTGAGATNTLVLTWPDGALNQEQALVQTSTNRGDMITHGPKSLMRGVLDMVCGDEAYGGPVVADPVAAARAAFAKIDQ